MRPSRPRWKSPLQQARNAIFDKRMCLIDENHRAVAGLSSGVTVRAWRRPDLGSGACWRRGSALFYQMVGGGL